MGRQAACACTWGSRSGLVTALLETTELIVRGEISERVDLSHIRDVRVDGDTLRFNTASGGIALALGNRSAHSWAKRLMSPPPSLAKKLGLIHGMRVHLASGVAELLGDALHGTVHARRIPYDIVLAKVEKVADLWQLPDFAPMWVIYRKGKDAPVGETAVRTALRSNGFIDVKICSIDAAYSALKFTRRHQSRTAKPAILSSVLAR